MSRFDLTRFRQIDTHSKAVVERRITRMLLWTRRRDSYVTAANAFPVHDFMHHRASKLAEAAANRALAFQALIAGNAEHAERHRVHAIGCAAAARRGIRA